MNRIRRPTLRDQLSSDYRDESSSENDEDKAVASTQTKRKGLALELSEGLRRIWNFS